MASNRQSDAVTPLAEATDAAAVEFLTDRPPSPTYILGHDKRELERLTTQARLIDPATRWFFREAGIARGMRVLDIGSGAGDVAFLVESLIGPSGEVVGTDRSTAALTRARERAQARELKNVTFIDGDPSAMTFDRPFDAMVGRFVLMFQPDPGAMLKQLKTHVRPGGIIAFHEADWANARSNPGVPTFEKCCAFVVAVLQKGGAHTRGESMLFRSFLAAGLPAPRLRSHAVTAGGADAVEEVRLLTDVVRTLSGDIVKHGIATATEIDDESLTRQIIAEMAETNAVITHRSDVAAWCRV